MAVLWWIFQVLLISRFFQEALAGSQRKFARLGLGILALNMLAIANGIYSWQLANSLSVLGVAVLAAMVALRIGFYWNVYRKNRPDSP
jgi:hypothetical protein